MKAGRPSANGKEFTLEQLTNPEQEIHKRVNIEIPVSMHSAFKALAAKRNSTIKDDSVELSDAVLMIDTKRLGIKILDEPNRLKDFKLITD